MKKDKKVKVLRKSTTKKRTSAKKTNKKNVKLSLLSRFQGLSKRSQILVFGLVFAVIGGGYYLYQSRASDGLPNGANELVVSYEIGMAHQKYEDNFSSGMGPSALLYGNGLLLCSSDIAMQHAADSTMSMAGWKSRQLSRDEVHALVDSLRSKGFDKAAAIAPADTNVSPVSVGRYIRINTSQGAEQASLLPSNQAAAVDFTSAESVLKSACATATAYEPQDVYAETITLPSDHPDAVKATTELTADVDVDTTPKGRKTKELKGADAKNIKSQLTRDSKVYKKGDQIIRARYVDRIPDWDEMKPKQQSSKGKVSAAAQYKTRWVVFIASDGAVPDWANTTFMQNTAGSIKDWYKGQVGKTFDIASYQVIRGERTAAQYKTCPANSATANYDMACRTGSSWDGFNAAYYNIQNELYARLGLAGYSTDVMTNINMGTGCSGLGGPASLTVGDNWVGRYNYGLAVSAFGSNGCNWKEGQRFVAAHELGHTFGLAHTCNQTLMSAGGASCPDPSNWPGVNLGSGQRTLLANYSLWFNVTSGTTSGGTTPTPYTGYGMKPGTSPSISGSTVVFQASTGNLYRKVIGGAVNDLGLGMMPGTSPSIDGDKIVFQANTGNLWRKNLSTGVAEDLKLGMAGGTSPSISGDRVAFQANTGSLFMRVLGGGTTNFGLGMAGGTSPAIYGDNIVFQANTGHLFRRNLSTNNTVDLNLGMAGGTSPAIYGNNVVFQANTGHLFLRVLGGGTSDLNLGMAGGTSPAIYGDKVAFQANTGHLFMKNLSSGGIRDTGLGMMPGTSPSIYGDNIVFQANTGVVWRYNIPNGTGSIL